MKRVLSAKRTWLVLALLVLVLGMSVAPTISYFTTYAHAEGGYVVSIPHTTIEETFSNWTKHCVIKNESSTDVFVRVKATCGSAIGIEYVNTDDNWYYEDGFFYYKPILPAHGQTTPADIKIIVPQDFTENFNVAVYEQTTPVLYEDGQPYADWDLVGEPYTQRYQIEGGTH